MRTSLGIFYYKTRPILGHANKLQERKPVSHVMIMCSSCYNAVPPPPCDGDKSGDSGKLGDVGPQALKDDTTQPQEGSGSRNEKPANVSTDQWKRFQELKIRRQHEATRSSKNHANRMRGAALRAVRKSVTVEDVEDVLQYDGVNVCLRTSGKRIPPHEYKKEEIDSHGRVWHEVSQYLDLNQSVKEPAPHHRHGMAKSGLEQRLEHAVDQGHYQTAAELSDQLAHRQAACALVSAIDSCKNVKRLQHENEAKKAKRQKLSWRFERKQRWETKGNM